MTSKDVKNMNRHIEIVKNMINDSRKGDLFNVELIQAAQEELKQETVDVITRAAEKSRAAKTASK